jgi:hypothetical protein
VPTLPSVPATPFDDRCLDRVLLLVVRLRGDERLRVVLFAVPRDEAALLLRLEPRALEARRVVACAIPAPFRSPSLPFAVVGVPDAPGLNRRA